MLLTRILALAAALALVATIRVLALAAAPFDIYTVLPMTGLLAFAGSTGATTIREVEGIVNKEGGIRGRPVHFDIHDDQSNPTISVQLMNDAIARGSTVVLGSMLTADCASMAPLADQHHVVQYCISPGIHPAPGSYVFAGGPATIGGSIDYARYMREHGWTKVALLSSTDASGQDLDDSFMTALSRPGNSALKLVAHERFNTTDISVTAQLARIKASGAQALVVYTSGSAFGTILHNIKDIGLNLPVFTTSSNETVAQLKQLTDVLPKELYFPAFPVLVNHYRNARERAVQDRFLRAQKADGIPPDAPSAAAWDPAVILVDALRAVGPDASAEQIHSWIENLHGYYGVYGYYDFRDGSQRGINSPENIVVARWDPQTTDWIAQSDFGGRQLASVDRRR